MRRERRDSHRTLVDLWGVGLWVPSGAASERKPPARCAVAGAVAAAATTADPLAL